MSLGRTVENVDARAERTLAQVVTNDVLAGRLRRIAASLPKRPIDGDSQHQSWCFLIEAALRLEEECSKVRQR